jgi:hypothetical protein
MDGQENAKKNYKLVSDSGGTNAPDDKGYTEIYSNDYAFAALKADGSINYQQRG